MKRVLFVITMLDFGGAEVQVAELARRLKGRGWAVAVAYMSEPSALKSSLQEEGVEVFSLRMKRGIPNPLGILRLREVIQDWAPDIVHSHMVHSNILARVTRCFCPMNCLISTAHGVYEHSVLGAWKGRFTDLLYRLTDACSDVTTIICEAGKERYLREGLVSKKRIRVVRNGIDTKRFSPESGSRAELLAELEVGKENFLWLAVGRFEPAKNYPMMIRAFAQFLEQYKKPAVLVIAGKGYLQAECQVLAEGLGVAEKIHFLGLRQDVPRLMAAADAYVMSSDWEGLPIVLLEASASGLPIVATNVGGIPEVVLDNETGFLAAKGDPQSFSEQMLKLAASKKSKREKMGEAACEYVRAEFDFAAAVSQWERLYETFL